MDRPSVLIIDDEPRILESLSLLLGGDFHVLTAPNGEEGLFTIKNNSPSIILLDLKMPGMPGLEVLENIRKADRDTKVIIMTGMMGYDSAKRCADLGVQGLIEKPFEPKELVARIKSLLGVLDCKVLQQLWQDEYKARINSVSSIVRKALDYVRMNYQKNFSRDEVAKHLEISPEYLSRVFQKECEMSLKEYINSCKIQKSQEHLLEKPDLEIKEIAASVGIPDANYFCRLFRKQTGMSPTEFRNKALS